MLVHRLLARRERVRMHLVLTPRTLPDVMSANVIAEIRGSEHPEEIVVVGAHLDSWDLGTGAIDDGSGVAMVMETMRLIKQLKLRPRRTIRAVLFMNEENGLNGGRQYWASHKHEKHVESGVPGSGLVPDPLHYFDYHHTPADTLDKIDPKELAEDSAAVAALAWIVANEYYRRD